MTGVVKSEGDTGKGSQLNVWLHNDFFCIHPNLNNYHSYIININYNGNQNNLKSQIVGLTPKYDKISVFLSKQFVLLFIFKQ